MTTTADRTAEIGKETWRLAWVIAFGAFTAGLDTSLVNVALRTIQTEFGTTLDVAQWVSSGYLLALAVSLPVCGWLGNRVGTGRLWLGALTAFTVISGLCAAAPTIGLLIALRVLQGLSAGLLVPAGQTILGRAVGPHRLGRVMARLGIAVTLAPALGPVVGGLLLDGLGWRWLFLLNVPVGAVVLLLGRRRVPRGTPSSATPLDWLGFGYVGVGLPLVVYGLTDWDAGAGASAANVWPLAVGAVALALFTRRSLRQRKPLLDLRLHARPAFAAACGAMVFGGVLMFGCTLLFPLYFQLARGEGVVATGLLTFAFGAGTAVTLPLAGRLTDSRGGGPVAVLGGLITVIVTGELALVGPDQPAVVVQLVLLALGVGTALVVSPLMVSAFRAVDQDQLPDATAQVNIVNRVGGALGAAVFAVVVDRGLSGGTTAAFQLAFRWQWGATLLALAGAGLLWLATRSRQPVAAQ